MFTKTLVSFLFVLPVVWSAPVAESVPDIGNWPDVGRSGNSWPRSCSVSKVAVPLGNQSKLVVPSGETSSIITVGRGIQNYTCTSGAYVSVGALANLYDVSCLFTGTAGHVDPATISSVLPQKAFSYLSYPDTSNLPVAIHHLFINTPGSTTAGAISPEFVGSNDKVVVSKINALSDPKNPADNVPWLQLAALNGQGTLSKSVFRLNTIKGQPPSSCSNEGEHLSVQYAAMYWFTK
ncbi:uncharacterized protein L203_105752 [Cryptococcus depauperatus CBS 7841]|uniref:Uncharacterized protein n=1 Tax=Cryptococcus depauperatus CBS 7841 TaxID=1295531 RepID=A0A1E3IG06_9TREE|nr:hypothetical protein L203_03628 [Cryptococcus depauperatus CBS 7841]